MCDRDWVQPDLQVRLFVIIVLLAFSDSSSNSVNNAYHFSRFCKL